MKYIIMFIFCITVFFNDGTYKIFSDASGIYGSDWGRTQIIRDKNGYVVAKIPTANIKYVDKTCEGEPK